MKAPLDMSIPFEQILARRVLTLPDQKPLPRCRPLTAREQRMIRGAGR